jgi:UDP-4-amino-4,6-dideoxy-N-acetyl-beta-L-altrosamine N-acetyltransferase
MSSISFKNILEVDEKLQRQLLSWRNREDIRKSMINQHEIGLPEHQEWLKNLAASLTQKNWLIFVDGFAVGSLYLTNINRADLSSQWGFYIGDPEFRGKGLGKEILYQFLVMFFEELKFRRLMTKVLSNNDAALNLYQKFHFCELGRKNFRQDLSVIDMSFTDSDWRARRGEIQGMVGKTK